MSYRDNSETLMARNAELTTECERLEAECARLKAQVAELVAAQASDNSQAVFQRQLQILHDENALMRSHLGLAPGESMEKHEASRRSAQAQSVAQTLGQKLWTALGDKDD